MPVFSKAKMAIVSLLGANLARVTLLSIGIVSDRAPLLSRILISLVDVVTKMAPDGAVETSSVSTVPFDVIVSAAFYASRKPPTFSLCG